MLGSRMHDEMRRFVPAYPIIIFIYDHGCDHIEIKFLYLLFLGFRKIQKTTFDTYFGMPSKDFSLGESIVFFTFTTIHLEMTFSDPRKYVTERDFCIWFT